MTRQPDPIRPDPTQQFPTMRRVAARRGLRVRLAGPLIETTTLESHIRRSSPRPLGANFEAAQRGKYMYRVGET